MARHEKTQRIIEAARAVLEGYHPMTVRQVYYRLVATQEIDNTKSRYNAVCNALKDARKEGLIPWDWIEDRMRRPRVVSMWQDLAHFADTARRAYRRDIWATQDRLVEVWLEKDALSGIFEDILGDYGVTLNVGRGYDGWTSIRDAAMRYEDWGGEVTVLYFGDFDPSGRDMIRSLIERIGFFEACPEMTICAILPEDIDRFDLPPNFTKVTDTRRAAFVEKHGDVAVELDALPIEELQSRLRQEVESRLDMADLRATRAREKQDRQEIARLLDKA